MQSNDLYPRFSDAEFARRYAFVRAEMQKSDLSSLIVFSTVSSYEENMTVVIQPNVITEDERMGTQVGELVRVTHEGVESLHRYPLRFVLCGL